MNRLAVITILYLCAICVSCGTKDPKEPENALTTRCTCFERDFPAGSIWKEAESGFVGIENISFENYPKVDGSTSASILNHIVACKLLGIRYCWMSPGGVSEWHIQKNWDDIPNDISFYDLVTTSQTHGAFMNLIDGKKDIIVTHRTISPDEKAHADAAGVKLIETPFALDAFVFIVNKDNPVNSLTIDQVQKIYTKKITNWSKVGGKNADMRVFTRPRNSGSEEVFRTLVMNGIEPADFPASDLNLMYEVFLEVTLNINSICYSFLTYKDMQARKLCDEVPVLAIDGICPDEETVKNRKYPFTSEVCVAIRSDLDRNSMAYKLYEWLQSKAAASTLIECGFIPI